VGAHDDQIRLLELGGLDDGGRRGPVPHARVHVLDSALRQTVGDGREVLLGFADYGDLLFRGIGAGQRMRLRGAKEDQPGRRATPQVKRGLEGGLSQAV
jgi:hypothetical protein